MNAEIIIGISSVLATILGALIQRTWTWRRERAPHRSSPLEYGSIREGTAFSVHDLVKVLDLRGSPRPGDGAPGVARLTDSYLVRRDSDDGNGAIFLYATSGDISGQCLSHPANHEWVEYGSQHMAVNRAIVVDLDGLAVKSMTRVTNAVTFRGAYDKLSGESFETHIERPVRELGFILIFDPAYPCMSAQGFVQVGSRGDRVHMRDQRPVVAENGRMLYWRILPHKGKWLPTEASYSLEWTWTPRPVALPAPAPAEHPHAEDVSTEPG